jgi:LPXTG-motif cell wall-anchored protein
MSSDSSIFIMIAAALIGAMVAIKKKNKKK